MIMLTFFYEKLEKLEVMGNKKYFFIPLIFFHDFYFRKLQDLLKQITLK